MADTHNRGIALVRRGLCCGRRKEMESAVLSLVQGLSYLDPEADPRLTLCAVHNLALFLSQLGTLVLARAVLQRAKSLYLQVDDPVMLARATWLEGTIARLAGNLTAAREKLMSAANVLELLDLRLAELVQEELRMIAVPAAERAA